MTNIFSHRVATGFVGRAYILWLGSLGQESALAMEPLILAKLTRYIFNSTSLGPTGEVNGGTWYIKAQQKSVPLVSSHALLSSDTGTEKLSH